MTIEGVSVSSSRFSVDKTIDELISAARQGAHIHVVREEDGQITHLYYLLAGHIEIEAGEEKHPICFLGGTNTVGYWSETDGVTYFG